MRRKAERDLRERRLRFLEDGRLDPEVAPPIGFAHLTTSAEFADLFLEQFEQIALWGLNPLRARLKRNSWG